MSNFGSVEEEIRDRLVSRHGFTAAQAGELAADLSQHYRIRMAAMPEQEQLTDDLVEASLHASDGARPIGAQDAADIAKILVNHPEICLSLHQPFRSGAVSH